MGANLAIGTPLPWPTALPLVAILRGIQPDEAVAHARVLLDAGFDCIEVPTNSPDWPRSIAAIVALAGTRALVGAGTVLTSADLDRLQAAGGRLAVSPHVDPALIADSVRRGLISLPGAMTPSEVFAAWRAGAHAVKLFPATTLGVGHVKAMAAVLPAQVSLLAVGGINVAQPRRVAPCRMRRRRAGQRSLPAGPGAGRHGATRRGLCRRMARSGSFHRRRLTPQSARPDLLSSSTNAMDDAALIGLDWGSSRLRAYLLRADGAVVEARSSDAGASRLAVGAAPAERAALFERHLRELVGDWLVPGRPMIACGMVGSAHGWREAAYVPCPVDLNEVHRHLTLVRGSDGLELQIVPGVSYRPAAHAPDVMRGEETQVIGVLARDPAWATGSSIVLPGTHSKWVRIVDGKLVSFATWMTGELFDILRSHSVLSRSLADAGELDARGIRTRRRRIARCARQRPLAPAVRGSNAAPVRRANAERAGRLPVRTPDRA